MSFPIKPTRDARVVSVVVGGPPRRAIRPTPHNGNECPCGWKHIGDVAKDVAAETKRKMEERRGDKS